MRHRIVRHVLAAAVLGAPVLAVAAPRLSIGDASVTEGDSKTRKVLIPITLSEAVAGDTTADWSVVPGTAVATDVRLDSGTITIPAGKVSANVGVLVKADTTAEPAESFTVEIVPPPGIDPGRTTGTVTILDDDPQTRVAAPSGVGVSSADLSANGRYLVFSSASTGIVPGDSYTGTKIFRRDLETGETILVTRYTNSTGGSAGRPSVSADGRYVAYETGMPVAGASDTNNTTDVEVRDLVAQTSKAVSVTATGKTGNAYSSAPSISDDGQRVAFMSTASDLVPGDSQGTPDAFVRDLKTGTTKLMSAAVSNGAPVGATEVSISGDGSSVAFTSNSSALTGPPTSHFEVYVRNVDTLAIVRASLAPGGVLSNGQNSTPSLDRDASHVAFLTTAQNLGAGPGGNYEGFVRELATGTMTRVSQNSTGGSPNAGIFDIAIDGTGAFVAFVTSASDVAPATATPGSHVFVRDVAAGATTQVDLDYNGFAPNGFAQADATIDGGGGRVAFISSATDLIPTATSGQLPFARDWAVNGVSVGDLAVVEPGALTAKLSFLVTSRLPAASAIPVDWEVAKGTAAVKDVVLNSGTTTIAAGAVSATVNVTIKGDTELESDETFTVRIHPHGQATARGIATATILDGTAGTFLVLPNAAGYHDLSGDGRILTYFTEDGDWHPEDLRQRNLVTGVDKRILSRKVSTGKVKTSADGRVVAVDGSGLYDENYPDNATSHVYLIDPVTKLARRVDTGGDLLSYANLGGVSADGRYLSLSSNVDLAGGTGVSTPHERTYVLDIQAWTFELVSLADNGTPYDKAVAGPISADGRFVTFVGAMSGSAVDCDDDIDEVVWRRDRLAHRTTLVTPYDPASQGACYASPLDISADGSQVLVYQGWHMGFLDMKDYEALYVRDGATGASKLLDHGPLDSCHGQYAGAIDGSGSRSISSVFANCGGGLEHDVIAGPVGESGFTPVDSWPNHPYVQISISDDGRVATACENGGSECHAMALPR